MKNIQENYQKILKELFSHPDYHKGIQIIAISKFQPLESILELFEVGQVCFGENRAQELREKYSKLPKEIDWHFVGNLQTNKAKYIPPICSCLHSLCSLDVAKALHKKCKQINKKLKVLIQMNLCQEEQKAGLLDYDSLQSFLLSIVDLEFLEPVGLMSIPDPKLSDKETAKIFSRLREYKDKVGKELSLPANFCELSMGMSHDYKIAISEGSTMIRLGTILFGKRGL